MPTHQTSTSSGALRGAGRLLGAAHPGPTVAVTLLAGLLCLPADVPPLTALLVITAVLTGQLSIGWSNDLLDLGRDRAVGRADKPLATGELSATLVRNACRVALVLTVLLSLATGTLAGVLHLVVVASGWAYNLRLKSTLASWVPYAIAFGALPAFVWVAGGTAPPPAVVVAGSLLGVGAHLLNAVPDLADDEATGVSGLPHRLGATASRVLAAGLLLVVSLVLAAAAPVSLPVRLVVLAVVVTLAVAAVRAPGRRAFQAAVAIAVLDVALLVVAA